MALADVPFLGAYYQRKQQNEQQPLAELQQTNQVMGMLANLQKIKEREMLTSGNMDDPEFLRRAGLALGKPEFLTHAERIDAKRASDSQLATMRSSPAIPPDPQELAQSADYGTPPVAGLPAKAGVFGTLMTSEIPQIAQAAKNYQAQMDSPSARAIKPEFWLNLQKGLQDRETALIAKPRTRTYQKGEESITEEQQPDGTWKELGRGPKFAKTVAPINGPDPATQPNADTIEMDAWRYLTDGTLPTNMGRGVQGAGQATAIRNRSAALAKEMGMTPDEIRMAQLTNKTQVAAIGQLAKAKAQILQFEKTAEMNADLAVKASAEVDRTQIPLVNKALQTGRSELLGDPKTKVFHAAMETFITEYARVMSGGYGAAQTNEGAQQRAHQLLNTSATPEQVKAVIGQLRAEMGNRVKALDSQMAEERNNLRNGIVRPKPGATPAPAPQGAGDAAVQEFATEADAAKAGLKPGARIKIGGQIGTWK